MLDEKPIRRQLRKKLSLSETISELFQEMGYELPTDISLMPKRDNNWLNKKIERSRPDPAKPVFVRLDI